MRNGFAGESLSLTPDLVNYIGRQAQAGRTDQGILTTQDARIAEAVGGAIDEVFGGPRDGDYYSMPVIPDLEEEQYQYNLRMNELRNRAFPSQQEEWSEPEILAGSPSFDLSYPKIPGRDVEGIPNANDPVMREKLRQRLLRNPNYGQELPGFLKRA